MADFYSELAAEAEDDSEVSDVDPAEMAKLIADFDDLEDDLFKKPKKGKSERSEPDVQKEMQKTVATGKKKTVKFEDENEELSGIFSDDDDKASRTTKSQPKVNQSAETKSLLKTPESKVPSISDEAKCKVETKPNKGKLMAELFGAEEKNESILQKEGGGDVLNKEPKVKADWLGLKEESPKRDKRMEIESKTLDKGDIFEDKKMPTATSSPISKRRQIRKTSFDDDSKGGDDILTGLGLGDGNSPDKSRRGTSIMDDLLGSSATPSRRNVSKTATEFTLDDKYKSSANTSKGTGSDLVFGSYEPTVGSPRESRRSVAREAGIVSHPSKAVGEQKSTRGEHNPPLVAQRRLSVDWLGVSDTNVAIQTKSDVHPTTQDVTSEHKPNANTPNLPVWLGIPEGEKTNVGTSSTAGTQETPSDAKNVSHVQHHDPVRTLEIDLTGTSLLQQQQLLRKQEEELLQRRKALMLEQQQQMQKRKQEEEERLQQQMILLQQKQQDLVVHQEGQLRLMMEEQKQRQMEMEMELKMQEDRFQSQLKTLMMGVSPFPSLNFSRSDSGVPVSNKDQSPPKGSVADMSERMITCEAEVRRLELENTHLERILENIQMKHLDELRVIEESFRRQLDIAEESARRREERLKAERDDGGKEYEDKLIRLEDERKALKLHYDKRMEDTLQEKLVEANRCQEIHRQEIDDLKHQHATALQNLSRLKTAEVEAAQNAGQHYRSLQLVVDELGRCSQELGNLHLRVDDKHQSHLMAREEIVKAKDREIKALHDQIMKEREEARTEREHLTSTLERLENRLACLNQEREEGRRELREERDMLEQERQKAMDEVSQQRLQLQKLREAAIAERASLAEERRSLASTRAMLELSPRIHTTRSTAMKPRTSTPIHFNNSTEIVGFGLQGNPEVEAALQLIEVERENLRVVKESTDKLQQELEREKRDILQKEVQIQEREKEVLMEKKAAEAIMEEGQSTMQEVQQLHIQQSAKAAELQALLGQVREREGKLMKERDKLEKVRSDLDKIRKRLICSYCRRIFTPSQLAMGVVKPIDSLTSTGMFDNAFSLSSMGFQSSLEKPNIIDPRSTIRRLEAERDYEYLDSNWSSLLPTKDGSTSQY